MATRTKPWTVSDPPSCAQNWTREERERCVAAANDTLARGGTDEEAIFACIGAAGKGEEKQDEPHPHGEHECYCPECGHEETAEADVKCNSLKCPECDVNLRARTAGEQREERLRGRENSQRRGTIMNRVRISINDKHFEAPCSFDESGGVEIGELLTLEVPDGWDHVREKFVSSPRNRFGTHSSYKFKGNYESAWRCHFSQVGGGRTSSTATGPIRGTVRRTEMIAAAMKPACNLPETDSIGPRKGPKSPLKCSFPKSPSDYGLSSWDKPKGEADREGMKLTCSDLAVIKRSALAEVKRRAKDREAKGKSAPEVPKAKKQVGYLPAKLKLFEKDGETYWMCVSSTAFKDREQEIVSRKALDYAVQFGDATGLRGHLNLYHLQNVKLGTCEFGARVDKVLLEAGRWLDNEYANAVKARLAQKDWGDGEQPAVSIEFWYDEGHVTDNVYDKVIIFNRALLKHKHAANQGTWFATTDDLRGEKDMSDKEDLVDWLGEELANKAWAEAEMHSKAIEQTGTEYKEVEMTDEARDEAVEEVTEEAKDEAVEETAETDVGAEVAEETETAEVEDKDEAVQEIILTEEALNAIADEVESRLGMKGLADALADLTAKVEQLGKADDEKVAEKVRRVPAETRVVIRESERKAESTVKKEEIIEPEVEDEEGGDAKDKIFEKMKAINSA